VFPPSNVLLINNIVLQRLVRCQEIVGDYFKFVLRWLALLEGMF